jgi:hypothetical protein
VLRKVIFSNFLYWYPQAFVFFELQTLCFLVFGGWLNFLYLLFGKLEF